MRPAPDFAARSVAGTRHIWAGRPCEDACHSRAEGGVVAVALADGHGSSARGADGAIMAVQSATSGLMALHRSLAAAGLVDPRTYREVARAPFGRTLVQAWQSEVQRRADVRALDRPSESPDLALTRRYGSTLMAALVTPEVVLCLALGDGATLWVSAEQQVSRPLGVDPHAFADETSSLCQLGAWRDLRVAAWTPPPEGGVLLMMTDGYVNSYADEPTLDGVAIDYARLIGAHGLPTVGAQLPTFLRSVSDGGCGDDVSLALIHLPPTESLR